MFRPAFATLFALLAVTLSGCGDNPTSSGESDITGTYTLATVNATAPPVTVFQSSEGRVEVTSGSMVLRADNSYTETLNLRIIPAAGAPMNESSSENGTYARNGSSVQFTVPASAGEPAFSYQGTVNGGTLSYTIEGTAVVFRK